MIEGISRGVALLAEMGVGKTKIAIDLAETMFDLGLVRRVLVVAPLSVVDAWDRELDAHASKSLWSQLLGSKQKRIEALNVLGAFPSKLHFFLINYDGIPVIEDYLSRQKFDMVVLDESTAIKNRVTRRAKVIHKLFLNTPYKLILSGNPVPKNPGEIFSQYAFVDPGIFGDNYYKFLDRYFVVNQFHGIDDFRSDALKKEFHDKLHSIAFRKRKDECLTLPPKIFENRRIELAPEQRQIYDRLKKEAVAAYQDKTISVPVLVTKILRLSQICGGNFPSEDGETTPILPNPKLEELIRILEEIPSSSQVVIWARFRAEIFSIAARLEKEGITHTTFFGDTSHKDRLLSAENFRTKKVRVFVGNPATAGKGINFLVGATNVVYYSLDYSFENYIQSSDRNHRSGTVGDKVLYIHLLARNTIDEQVLAVLRRNKNVSEAILNREIIL